jgi:oligopeptide/dipeptide ABC transporter ATP-binding protein
MADQTAVMYLGKVVEHAPTQLLFDDVRHPYSRALFSAVLLAGSADGGACFGGVPPSPLNPPDGCRFHTRCPYGALLQAGASLA